MFKPYRYADVDNDEISLSRGARLAQVTHQRFSRALRSLDVPVRKVGSVILFKRIHLKQIKEKLKSKKEAG